MERKGKESCPKTTDDEYIDIEVSNSFSPESRSFEFQMCSVFGDDDEEDPTAIFPADDLFYKGKLLPLSLQTLPSVEEDDFIIMDFASSPSTNTPLKPCRLSFELSNNGFTTLISNKHPPGKFWSEKLRMIKKYYKSPPGTEKQAPNGKKTPLFPSMGRWRHPIIAGVIKKINKGRIIEDHKVNHRSSSDFYELNFHNRSFSFASCSDFEGSIEAAITHCKQSQELPNPRKAFIEAGHYHYLLTQD
nr:probable membrane-associated kinase regulator 4 [Ipomoea batatas]GMC86397.1 probable membrane-associated kinase regulator 4 [Ipomoea batatas]GMC86399.1 probable membrane-associated kinase regulator 4 [Ipomoea batatas]